ncbi:hypothetical protein SAPIO_CDS8488 [Scedosporium apiospermum]|uniref:Uncharacterized protein n=1 Tax=Pseudallescheria apiosperma TaxID=563466 RepID=A0A084FZR3_PSEDA|nr:uncharacterized protein SAPIO_CDS8488 [Scedosporium apiospermum]KEZ40575.1 hypothetical protein SAPIO_CDS8488 [Scedosporium apiospermum]
MTTTSTLPTPPSAMEAPPKQAPMDATPQPGTRTATIISQQPTSEPKPEMRSHLRGGGMSLGFDCCGGSCRFYKTCC